MSTSGSSQTIRFETRDSIPESQPSTSEPETQESQLLRTERSMSLWKLPGFDKETFYAAALYLHAAAGSLESKPWIRGPKTPEATRKFLDCLADCFARSKLKDARDHVSATAMVRDGKEKRITLYIAKNKSQKDSGPAAPGEPEKIADENRKFATELGGMVQ